MAFTVWNVPHAPFDRYHSPVVRSLTAICTADTPTLSVAVPVICTGVAAKIWFGVGIVKVPFGAIVSGAPPPPYAANTRIRSLNVSAT